MSGAKIYDLTNYAKVHLNSDHPYDYIYLFAGVNHLSVKQRSGRVTAAFDNVASLVDTMTDYYENARYILSSFAKKVVICQLTGLNLDMYNQQDNEQIFGQQIIDQAVPHINHAINLMNQDSEVSSPWLQTTIHAKIHHRPCHKYRRFSDGIHPSDQTLILWAQLLIKSFLSNFKN